MDWIRAPIHTRAELKKYLKATATTGSPLDSLSLDARKRFLSSIYFGPHGAGRFDFSDLQYLSTTQVYKILALFGEQSLAIDVTDGQIRIRSFQPVPKSGKLSTIQRKFNKYWNKVQVITAKPGRNVGQPISNLYDQLFALEQKPKLLAGVANGDLRLLFRAAGTAAFYTYDAKYARDMRIDFVLMEKHHFLAPSDYHEMYKAYIETRQFAMARNFYLTYPQKRLTPFPEYRDESGHASKSKPTILVVSTTRRELIRRPVDLDKSALVVILMDPNCHFCRDLNRELRSRPKLKKVLYSHVIWLAPPTTELEFDSLQAWDKAHPDQHVNIMYSSEGWPMSEVMGTPIFFFLSRGHLEAKHVGWLGKKDFSALEKGLEAIGLWK